MQTLSRGRRRSLIALSVAAAAGAASLLTASVTQAQTATKPAAKSTAKPAAKPAARPAARPATGSTVTRTVAAGAAAAASTADGKQIYTTTCVACHQAAGEGVPDVYPPLAGSEWVTGDEGNLARIILHGMTGPVEVQGETYQGVMPPWGGVLKDADVAALATYIRSSWGNKASPVTAATVARIRASGNRTTPWTAPELQKLAGKK